MVLFFAFLTPCLKKKSGRVEWKIYLDSSRCWAARTKAWCPLEISAVVLSAAQLQKKDLETSSFPSISTQSKKEKEKTHHFLLLCESLIYSRQKSLIRKLFRKLKGKGGGEGTGSTLQLSQCYF